MDEVVIVLDHKRYTHAYFNGELLHGCKEIQDLGKYIKKEEVDGELRFTFRGHYAFEDGVLRKKLTIHRVI